MSADLHIHSTASDGTLTPAQIVRQANETGLSAISLTDHDTVDGVQPAIQAALKTDLEVIPGIELNTDLGDVEIHILGYYLEIRSKQLQNVLNELRHAREDRAQTMIKKLSAMGIFLSFDRLQEIAGFGTIGRPHIAQAMMEAGYVSSIREAFDNYLRFGKPAYVPRHKLDPFRAIEIVQNAAGIPVLAHPGLMNKDELIPEFVEKGILGIEVYYPQHTPDMIEKYCLVCEKYGLIKTGGTDCHGPGMDYPPLGTVTVTDETVAHLKRVHRRLQQNHQKKQES